MKRYGWFAIALVVLGVLWSGQYCAGQAPTRSDEPLSERRVTYNIQAVLDPATVSVKGNQRVTWRNPDQVPVDELQFHLYLNAFRDTLSTFMIESSGEHRGFSAESEDAWGGIDIRSMRLTPQEESDTNPLDINQDQGADLMDRITFIQPDDGNVHDKTVISVSLPEPVPPGESISLDIEFDAKLPEVVARTGWKRKANDSLFFMVAQWFPKLGVYEAPGHRYVPADAPRGSWSTHQFHANSEFYADFGTYEVAITVPTHYKVGASGISVHEEQQGGTRTVTYRAEDVHDFAWTASGDFLEFNDSWEEVNLRLLIQPEHKAQAQRHFDVIKKGLRSFNEWVGPYPYSTLTLVDGVGGSNGMEYPTLITCGTFYKLPRWLRFLELVTIHELGHQYFYGMLASNEAEEAWLDEGINSYLEARIMDQEYGKGSALDLPWLRVMDGAFHRVNMRSIPAGRGALFTRSWEYFRDEDYDVYGDATYSKPVAVLTSLEHYLGWETMQQILRTYYQEWAFKHPTTRDFVEVAERVSGESLTWFTDQYIYGTARVDYAVEGIDAVEDPVSGEMISTVTLRRELDGSFPLSILFRFEDGTERVEKWNGEDREKTFTFRREVAVEHVHIDPEDHVWLDINKLNNGKQRERDSRFARNRLFNTIVWFQQVLQITSNLF